MPAHIHADAVQATWTVAVVIVGLHTLRMAGGFLASKGGALAGVGRTMGALATFNGG